MTHYSLVDGSFIIQNTMQAFTFWDRRYDLVSRIFDKVGFKTSHNSSPYNTHVKRLSSLKCIWCHLFFSWLHLLHLLEMKKIAKSEKCFTSTESFPSICTKLEEATKLLNFDMKKINCIIKMEGNKNGRKGNLVSFANIFKGDTFILCSGVI